MATYKVIADVSTFLLEQIRKVVCPGLLPHPDLVSNRDPGDEGSQALLHLYLYGVRHSTDYVPQPPLALVLQYVLYFSRRSQTPLDPSVEQLVFGRLLEWFYQHPTEELVRMHPEAGRDEGQTRIGLAKLANHEQRDLWSGFQQPLRPALYLEVEPLLLGGRKAAGRVYTVEGQVKRL